MEICAVHTIDGSSSDGDAGDTTITRATVDDPSGQPTDGLVYGEVLTETSAAGAPLPAYSVRVGPAEVVQLLPTEMYSFKTGAAVGSQNRGMPSASRGADAFDPTLVDVQLTMPLEESSAETSERGHGVAEHEYLQAVSSLLSRAGLSLQHDAREMMGRVLALEADNAAVSAALSTARDELVAAKKTMAEVDNERTCTICFMGAEDGIQVNTALTPCGHCYCAECAQILVTSKCPTCKRQVSGSIKVFR
jgi:hypothetical protein